MTSLTEARQFTARETGPFRASTAHSSSTGGAVIDLTWPIRSNNDQDSLYQDHYLYRPAANTSDRVRTVRIYTASAGSLAPDLPHDVAAVAGEAFELLGTLDPQDIERAINNALKEILVEAEFTITPVNSAVRHTLPTAVAEWLTEPEWIRQVGYLTLDESANRDNYDPYDGRLVRGEASKDGGRIYLKHPHRSFDPANTVLYVKTMKPAFYHCRADSTGDFGDKTDGLTAEANEAPVALTWLASAALVECWRQHGRMLEPGANAKLIRDFAEAVVWYSEQTEIHLDVPQLTFLPTPRAWGPRSSHGGY